MEAFALYLLKSVIWISGFALVFILFLRNERFFLLNRIYLITGILISFFFPLISIHYTVLLPVVSTVQTGNDLVSEIQNVDKSILPDLKLMLLIFYAVGVLFILTLIVRQGRSVLRAIKRAEITNLNSVKLVKTPDYTSSFSFFSYVFVNPSITDIETKEIMNHEIVHIRQRHWLDLVLVQLLCMMQWFNPLVWIYVRFIRQNHEYLADEVALQRTSDPAIYRAALLNQIVGAPVVSLANSFNYSLNKKRFNMMKDIICSPYRKLKILLILPVFAIVLFAFAKPDYKYVSESSGIITSGTGSQQKEVKGTVVQQNGKPLQGATIVVQNTYTGTSTDAGGYFKLNNIPENGALIVSYVGYKSKVVKPDFKSEMKISMIQDTIKYLNSNISTPPPPPPPPPPIPDSQLNADGTPPLYVVDGMIVDPVEAKRINPESIESVNVFNVKDGVNSYATKKYGEKGKNGVVEITTKKVPVESGMIGPPPPPPPPPPSGVKIISADGKKPLVVVDGVITDIDVEKIDSETIESITVLKNKSSSETPATNKYGEKGKDGVVEVTTKKSNAKELSGKEPYVVVEELPEFPGGKDAMKAWISKNINYPQEAYNKKIQGQIIVSFVVTSQGKVKNVKVIRSLYPQLDIEASRVISSMPDWKPGSQAGKTVDVQMQVPVEFKL
jgi:TonB family protein